MTNKSVHPHLNASESDPQDSPDLIRSRDEVVKGILEIHAEEAEASAANNEHQLRRLTQALRNRKGRFGLMFAVCNDIPLRKELTQRIIAGLTDQHPVELQLNGRESSLLDTLLETPGKPEPLIAFGIELLLPSTESQVRRREQTIHELQLRREQFRKLARPLLLWMPEYVYTLIGQEAVDFWSWQSGGFFFASASVTIPQPELDQSERPASLSLQLGQDIPNIYVVGREQEVDTGIRALREGRNLVIQGMGGMGKSSFAYYLASRLKDDYPDGHLLIRPSSDSSSVKGLKEAIWYFHPDETLPDEEGALVAIYRQMLRGKHALIILEDAPDDSMARSFLPPQGSVLLVTARKALRLPDQELISLDTLSPQAATALLRGLVPNLSLELAKEICLLCGYLPLAIQVVGGSLASMPDLDFGIHVRRLREAIESLKPNGSEGNPLSLEASLNLSYESLQPQQARVFRCLAIFPESFDASAEEAICEDPNRALSTGLEQRALLLHDEVENRYRLHVLAREFAVRHLSVEEQIRTALLHATYYAEVTKHAAGLYIRGDQSMSAGLYIFDLEWENIKAGESWSAAHSAESDEAAKLCNDYVDNGWPILDLRLDPRQQSQWLEAALSSARRIHCKDAEGRHLSRLGIARATLGEPDRALEFYQQALTVFREIGDLHSQGITLSQVGGVYEASGKFQDAISAYERSLSLVRDAGDHRREAWVLSYLGVVYAERGGLRRGIEYFETSLTIAREVGDRRLEGHVLNNLGIAYHDMGQAQRSIETCRQALEIFRNLGDKQGESQALGTLGQATKALGNLSGALSFYRESLSVARALGDRKSEAEALGNLGELYQAMGDGRRAIEFSEQALAIFRQINYRWGEGQVLGNVGLGYRLLGDFHRAIEYFEQTLAVAREHSDRRNEGISLGNLGVAYASLGDKKRALESFEQQLKLSREVGDLYSEGSALSNMSLAEYELGNPANAIAYAQEAVRIFEEIESPAAAAVRDRLAQWTGQKETVSS